MVPCWAWDERSLLCNQAGSLNREEKRRRHLKMIHTQNFFFSFSQAEDSKIILLEWWPPSVNSETLSVQTNEYYDYEKHTSEFQVRNVWIFLADRKKPTPAVREKHTVIWKALEYTAGKPREWRRCAASSLPETSGAGEYLGEVVDSCSPGQQKTWMGKRKGWSKISV